MIRMQSGFWQVEIEEIGDDDVVKLYATATHTETGETRHIPHSPYQVMTQDALDLHVRNNFEPKIVRGTVCNWRNEEMTHVVGRVCR